MKLRRNRRRRVLLFSFWLVLLAVGAGAAEKSQSPVQVRIGTIFATNETECSDPSLAKMKSQLEVLKYRCYRMLKDETQKASWRGDATFEIPGGGSLVVTFQEFRNKRIALKLRWLEGEQPVLDTTVTIPNRGSLLLGGRPHENGVLILSVSAATQ